MEQVIAANCLHSLNLNAFRFSIWPLHTWFFEPWRKSRRDGSISLVAKWMPWIRFSKDKQRNLILGRLFPLFSLQTTRAEARDRALVSSKYIVRERKTIFLLFRHCFPVKGLFVCSSSFLLKFVTLRPSLYFHLDPAQKNRRRKRESSKPNLCRSAKESKQTNRGDICSRVTSIRVA